MNVIQTNHEREKSYVMMNKKIMKRLVDAIDDGRGYCIKPILSEEEFQALYLIVEKKWKHRMESMEMLDEGKDCKSIKEYHDYITDQDHEKMWSKTARLFTKEEVDLVMSMNMYGKIKDMLGDIMISDEENIGYPNIYWRLVRPMKAKDVGPVHRDEWPGS